MAFSLPTPDVQLLRTMWDKLQHLPMGSKVFSEIFSRVVPYTGSISPEIVEIRPGYAKVTLKDSRRVRNHLKSVHAMALANLGEAATGLALNFALPETHRAILVNFQIEYIKKARGTLTGVSSFPVPGEFPEGDFKVEGTIKNEMQEVVARCTALWRVGTKK